MQAKSGAVEADDEGAAKKERREMSPECQARVAAAADEDDAVDPGSITQAENALALGRCFADVGDIEQARAYFERATQHPGTKRRAVRALRALPNR